ncbi:MAG: pyridoxal phosphate-dependent decarboxylase family protein [Syntrophothermus sp.]
MKKDLKGLEQSALQLEPGADERKALMERVLEYSENFLNRIHELPSFISNEDTCAGLYDMPITDEGTELEKLLEVFEKNVMQRGINAASRGHLGYIPGGGIYHSALADYLAAVTNRYAGVYFAAPGAVEMENMLIDWMAGLIGYPKDTGGNLTSGGSIANLTGIVTARDFKEIKARDIERSVIYMTTQVHHSVDKAIRIAGLKECVQRFIPVDGSFRMCTDLLENAIKEDKSNGLNPFLVIASAGTTDTGAVDPLQHIGEIASANSLWFHLDAAYGGFFIMAESAKALLKGMELSDSVIMDPHKSLFLPYGSGAVLIKDKMSLLASHHYTANYMQDAYEGHGEFSPADLSPELSKHFRGLRLWLPLKLLGTVPFSDSLEEKIQLTRYFHEKLQSMPGFETGPYPDLSVSTFRYIPEKGNADEFNKNLVSEIHKDGRLFLSSTVLNGNYTLRLAVLSFRTHRDTIDEMLSILNEKTMELTGRR